MIQGIMNAKIEITLNKDSALAAYELDLIAAGAILGAFGPDEAFATTGLTFEQIQIITMSTWFRAVQVGNVLMPIGVEYQY